MARTFFFAQDLIGQGSGDVESLRSFIERLAIAHHMTPRALLETLVAEIPLQGLAAHIPPIIKRWGIHGYCETGSQILARLESTTGSSLNGSTLSRFSGLFAATNLTRANCPLYCPQCVATDDALPYTRLLWEMQCVTSCPVHGIKLRAASICGAPSAEHLDIRHRPRAGGVCSQCGSVGYRCVTTPPESATVNELWLAEQAYRLLALSDETISLCTSATLRAGLRDLVEQVCNGSVANASLDSGLSKGQVTTWLKSGSQPALPWLLQFCWHHSADVCALIQGRYKRQERAFVSDQLNASSSLGRRYHTSVIDDVTMRRLLIEASKETEPPSLAEFGRRHSIDPKSLRKRFREEANNLVAASQEWRDRTYRRRFDDAVKAYIEAAQQLRSEGKTVHSIAVQRRSGLVAHSQNPSRVRALQKALQSFPER